MPGPPNRVFQSFAPSRVSVVGPRIWFGRTHMPSPWLVPIQQTFEAHDTPPDGAGRAPPHVSEQTGDTVDRRVAQQVRADARARLRDPGGRQTVPVPNCTACSRGDDGVWGITQPRDKRGKSLSTCPTLYTSCGSSVSQSRQSHVVCAISAQRSLANPPFIWFDLLRFLLFSACAETHNK